MGSRYRLTGSLLESRRGLLLLTDDGAVWALDIADDRAGPSSERVRLEGVRTGLDRLAVHWIAPLLG